MAAAPTILQLQVHIPSTPSILFQFVLLKLLRGKDENKQKEARFGPFLKKDGLVDPEIDEDRERERHL